MQPLPDCPAACADRLRVAERTTTAWVVSRKLSCYYFWSQALCIVCTLIYFWIQKLLSLSNLQQQQHSAQKPDHYSEWYKLVTPHAPFQQPHGFFSRETKISTKIK